MKILLTALVFKFALLTSCLSTKNADDGCIDEKKINPDQMCTAQYDPVCGCNSKTYGNACEADRAGVTSFTKGACNTNQ
jgi:hypothetical protein